MIGVEVTLLWQERQAIFYYDTACFAGIAEFSEAPERRERGPIILPDDAVCATCGKTAKDDQQ